MRQKGNNMNEFPHEIVVDGSRASLGLMTGKRLGLVALTICTVVCSSLRACGASGPIVDADSSQSWNEMHGNGMVGWTFNLLQPLTITGVGWYDDGQDGLSRAFQVGLWQDLTGSFAPGSTPTQLLGTSADGMNIPGGTTATLQGSWRVVPLSSPLNLPAGNYELGGLDTATTPDTIKYVLAGGMYPYPPAQPGLTIGAFFYASPSAPSPTFQVTYSDRFYLAYGLELGPMLFTSVPEPGAFVLVGLGSVMALLLRRRISFHRPVRKLSLLLLLVMLSDVAQAQFTYVTNNGAITITGYTGTDTEVTIPGFTNGYPVTSIGDSALSQNAQRITRVTIQSGITNIGNYAFAGCFYLTNIAFSDTLIAIGSAAFQDCALIVVNFPDSLTTIQGGVFSRCHALSSKIAIPAAVTYIGTGAFSGTAVNSFEVAPLNVAYSSMDGVLFDKQQTTLLAYPPAMRGSYLVPQTVTSIGEGAFSSSSVTSVTIANSVTNIGSWAFDSSDVTSVTILEGVTSMGDAVFYFCRSLMSVTFPTTLTSIPSGTFQSCVVLTNVVIPNGVTSIGSYAFHSCYSLPYLQLPDSVTNIGASAFRSCYHLLNAELPRGLTSIADSTFYSCYSLTNVIIPSTVTSIGAGAFSTCESLTNITIPESVVIIGSYAFDYSPSLKAVYFRGIPPTLGTNVFRYDDTATIYYLPGMPGWGSTFGGRPTALWSLPFPLILSHSLSFGVQSNQFGFVISWATNALVVVEAATDLAKPLWSAIKTNTLINGSCYFSDAAWTSYPVRFYRIRSP